MFKHLVLALFIAASLVAAPNDPVVVTSPDGATEIVVSPGSVLKYSVRYHGQRIIADAALNFTLSDGPALGVGAHLVSVSRAEIRETWTHLQGKRSHVLNHANEVELVLASDEAGKRTVTWTFRAYNDGIAFRYGIPMQPGLEHFTLVNEQSEFRFLRNLPAWVADYGGFVSPQEEHFNPTKLDELSAFKPYGCPVLVQIGDDCWGFLSEAAITDWAGTYFSHSPSAPHTLVTSLSPRADDPTVAVLGAKTRKSPWRTLALARTDVALTESNLVHNLNEPCAIADTSWIKPGKAAWDRWWCGDYLPDAPFKSGMNQDTMKYFIDFAADMGWTYQIVDWQWYGPPFHPEKGYAAANPTADITRTIPEVNIPELVTYAKAKGIRLFLWLEWSQADKQMDEAFALYEKWGIAGVKIDFMNRDDQQMVEFYHRCVAKAAEHHLLVDFHGAFKPDGWARTYPNLITREGVMGNEYNKWSTSITADHCLTLPFTRGLLGEMDFTPGGWRNRGAEGFRIVGGDAPGPFVVGTRCFQMAMLVVYDSGMQVLCDSPYNYRSSPAGLDFLKAVPTVWDDTHGIAGAVGDYIATARRTGDAWFVGAMTDGTARTLKLPLEFLGAGEYTAEIWCDAYEVADFPDRLRKEVKTVTSTDSLEAALGATGGYVAILRPKK